MSNAARPIVALATAGIVIASGFGAAGVAGASARPSTTNKITGGTISVKLNASAVAAMKKGHVKLSAISPSTFAKSTITSKVTGGTLDIIHQAADVHSSGGFKISEGSKSVSVTGLESKSSPTGGKGMANVSGHGRIEAITTTPPTSTVPAGNTITASGFTVTLSPALVKILDKKFHTKLFKSHAAIGTGAVKFTFK